MKNQWPIWLFVVGGIIIVLFALNFQAKKDAVPLAEVFPEEGNDTAANVEYEFMDSEKNDHVSQIQQQPAIEKAAAQPVKAAVKSQVEAVSAAAKAVVSPAQEAKASRVSKTYTIQVASHKDKATAQKALDDMRKAGLDAYLVSRDLGEKGTWHRIYVGRFDSKTDAGSTLTKLKDQYKDSFIISSKGF